MVIKLREVSVNSSKLVLFTATLHVDNKEEMHLNILLQNGKNRQESISPTALSRNIESATLELFCYVNIMELTFTKSQATYFTGRKVTNIHIGSLTFMIIVRVP
jgi:hypothetical protein